MNWPTRTVPRDLISRLNSKRSLDARLARWSPEFFRRALRVSATDPRPFRERILDWQEKTKDMLKARGKITISGLEGPVMVRQFDDENIEIFLNYSLAIDSN